VVPSRCAKMALATARRMGVTEVGFYIATEWFATVTGAPYREVNSKVATAPNTQGRR